MTELRRYRIIAIVENETHKFGRYYGRSKSAVARKAFKYLSRLFNCNRLKFDIQDCITKEIFTYEGDKIEKLKPLAKKVSNTKYIIIKYDYSIRRLKNDKETSKKLKRIHGVGRKSALF